MNKFKKLYRDFFGLTEATGKIETDDPAQAETMAKKGMNVKLVKPGMTTEDLDAVGHEDADIDNDGKQNTKSDQYLKNRRMARKKAIHEIDIDEAQLVNNLTDYRGGIEYVLRDPATAQQTAQEIQEWAERKGFTIIKKTISPSGKIGYFYFRLGQDPALESQKLQGYLAQKPELKHFRFNVRQQALKKPQRKI
jgi:hypothetical protein